MNGNQVVSAMFDVKTSIHMVRIVLVGDWNEDHEWLGLVIMVAYTTLHLKTSQSHDTDPCCMFWWLCPTLGSDNMDLIYMFRSLFH